jgi:GDP-L-fucose synthase
MVKKKILILGGAGFVGTNLLKKINKSKFDVIATYNSNNKFFKVKNTKYIKIDLLKKIPQKIFNKVEMVFMCAANTSGAKVMTEKPLSHLTPNLIMNALVLEKAQQAQVKKFIFISSSTVYPVSNKAMTENDMNFKFFEKYYVVGWMKAFSEIMCRMYSEKIKNKLQTIVIRPGNLYGPHDKFDPEKAKVIPSLIRKFMAKTKSINVWGDGNDVKDFMYVEDFCEIALKISQKSKKSMTINIASGNNITIKEILKKLIIATKHSPKINFDLSKPQMIKFRKISNTKMRKFLSNKIKLTKFEIGLKKTLEWYNNDYK